MDDISVTPDAQEPKKAGRHSTLTPEIHEKILGFVRKGLTYEKAGEALGISPATIQNWQHRNKAFNESLQKERRQLEANLLDSINQAGEKSWQARAWILERSFQYSQPSARLNVTQEHTHGISSNLASLLAGIAGRKKITSTPEKRQIESGHNYIDVQPVATKPENHLSNNKYCINNSNSVEQQQDTQAKTPKLRHKQMRRRKPRAESLAKYPTTTPPATPPAPI
jgi:hypothetical protein